MTTVALLRIVQGLHGMYVDKVAAMVFGLVIPPEIGLIQVFAISAPLVAIQAPGLIMALPAVVAGLAGQNPVVTNEICLMVWRNSLSLMAVIAFPYIHPGIFLVCHLCSKRHLLEIHKGTSQKHNHCKDLFHRRLLSKNHS